jgi:hypothetical protein
MLYISVIFNFRLQTQGEGVNEIFLTVVFRCHIGMFLHKKKFTLK